MSAGSGKRKKATDSGGEESGAGEVGRLVDCSQADDRRMIRLVRERPLLYARNNMPVASYYARVKKLWQQVADLMGWTVPEVRRKWSHIRNSYSRHLRNEMYGVRTGRGRIVSKWYLADELDFLREHMATDTRPASRYSFPLFEAEAAPELPALLSSPWLALAGAPHAAPPPRSGEPQLRPDDSSSPHSFDPDENSAYFHFFRGIHNDYQELPAKKQRLFRRECLAFLHRLLDEEEPVGQQEAPGSDDERECKPCIVDHSVRSVSAEPEPDPDAR
ncbi:hypothetical protein B5X24_HaOG208654 [Helicoverpa armigera]|uniref:MADF domain-containing protein n=1 Tax=Helicoverpa armigera TaxID=29058 RepID=A0A2W1BQE3_HELAM|nr:hypothetical protein B5X24_HaOG208654 [Helicoverpa armigera]